jgi:hypothetical protein
MLMFRYFYVDIFLQKYLSLLITTFDYVGLSRTFQVTWWNLFQHSCLVLPPSINIITLTYLNIHIVYFPSLIFNLSKKFDPNNIALISWHHHISQFSFNVENELISFIIMCIFSLLTFFNHKTLIPLLTQMDYLMWRFYNYFIKII